MKRATRTAFALSALAGSVAGIGAGAASAATVTQTPATTYAHVTKPAPTKAACVNDFAAFTKTFASRVKFVSMPTDCQLGANGWQASQMYVASKPAVAGDQSQAQNPWTGVIAIAHYTHGPYAFATKSDANTHMQWMIGQVKAHPNTAQLEYSKLTQDAKTKKWVYTVGYLGSAGIYASDNVWMVA